MRLYYWIEHTGRHDMSTGVQRVVRNLAAALVEDGCELIPVRWCPEREAIIHAEQPWITGLARFGGPELVARPEAGTPLHLSPVDDRPRRWMAAAPRGSPRRGGRCPKGGGRARLRTLPWAALSRGLLRPDPVAPARLRGNEEVARGVRPSVGRRRSGASDLGLLCARHSELVDRAGLRRFAATSSSRRATSRGKPRARARHVSARSP